MNNQTFSFSVFTPQKRLDVFLAEQLNAEQAYTISREKIKKTILLGQVSVNNKACLSPKQSLALNDLVCFTPEQEQSSLKGEDGHINIIQQLGDILIVNKESGLTVHPCESQKENTLVQRLLAVYPQLGQMEGLRPGIVHRLDKDTSGLVMVALSEPMSLALSKMFSERKVHKKYLALVYGEPKGTQGTIDLPLGRDPNMKTRRAVLPLNKGGTEALSYWKKLWVEPSELFSLVEVEIITGRTHQIRVHFSAIGHPLLGDRVYETEVVKDFQLQQPAFKSVKRQMLHAWHLEFELPDFNQKSKPSLNSNAQSTLNLDVDNSLKVFRLAPPQDFIDALVNCAKRPWRIILTGSAGAGKSTVLQVFSKLGIDIFSADQVVNDLYQPDNEGWVLIDKLYSGHFTRIYNDNEELGGKSFYSFDKKTVDKRALFDFIKENPSVKRDIEEFVHPLVKHALDDFWQKERSFKHGLVSVAEIPLFFEAKQIFNSYFTASDSNANMLKLNDIAVKTPAQPLIISVCCDKKIREARLHQRGLSENDIAMLTAWQWSEEKKKLASDFVIENSEDISMLEKNVHSILNKIEALNENYILALKKVVPE